MPLRLLLVEDNPTDADLIVRQLRRAGFDPDHQRVDSEPAFLARLHPELDVILSDYRMPQFSGVRALDLLNERDLDIPFIIISGAIGEEAAVDALKQGASDYLLKDRLARLGPAVQHAMEKRSLRREKRDSLQRERAAHAEAERASRLKDEFLATLSHELRTPLNGIYGWARLLLDSNIEDPEVRQGIEIIEESARAQKRIVDDLLDMSHILAGKLRLDMQPVALGELIRSTLESVRLDAQAKGIQIEPFAADPAHQVYGDPARLQQVMWNLLSNALKFTPPGGRVQISLRRADSTMELRVSDDGPGIDRDFLPYLFDRFRQQDSSSTRCHDGLGLGLSIVKNLVELHGGTVRAVTGGEDRGTTLVVMLPLWTARQREGHAAARPAVPHLAAAHPNAALLTSSR